MAGDGGVVAGTRRGNSGLRAGATCQQVVEDQGQGAVAETGDLRAQQQFCLLCW